jgi:phosphate butyryltransferase
MTFSRLEKLVLGDEPLTIAVAGARGDEVFEALADAANNRLARFVLTGDREEIARSGDEHGLTDYRIIPAAGDEEAAAAAVEAVRCGDADLIMKGKVATAVLLKAVLDEKTIFNTGRLLSHVLVLEHPEGRLIAVTDGGMNIRPDLNQKEQILSSAVELMHALGIDEPKVAVLAAMEKENPKIPESVDAAELQRRWESGGIPGCVVEGPMALDLAVSPRACELKDWNGRIRGDADVLLVHDISGGNYLGKSLIYNAGYPGGGLVLGGGRPVILLSRSDSAGEKYRSILLALARERSRRRREGIAGQTTGEGDI